MVRGMFNWKHLSFYILRDRSTAIRWLLLTLCSFIIEKGS